MGVLLLGLQGCQANNTKPSATPRAESQGGAQTQVRDDGMRAATSLMGLWALEPRDEDVERPTSWHRHDASGTCMPTGSQSWKLRVERVFGPNDEGVSIWNEELKTLVSLFTYPARQDIESEMKLVTSDMARTCSEGPMLGTVTGDRHFAACVKRLENDVLLVEQVTLIKRAQWLYKVRITFPEPFLMRSYGPTMAFSDQAFAACAKD